MNWKIPLFFIVAFTTILYLAEFLSNRHEKTSVKLFGKKVEMSLGILLLGTFLDGVIIATLLIWLFN